MILADGDAILPASPEPVVRRSRAGERSRSNPLADLDLSGSLMDATRRALAVVERMKIEEALKEADSVKGRAAELLQISYKMLLAKLKEHRLE